MTGVAVSKKRFLAGVIFTVWVLSGCTAIIGKTFYDSGELTSLHAASFDNTLEACRQTLMESNLHIEEWTMGGIQNVIHARWPDGTPLTIKIEMKAMQITSVAIRSGHLGIRDRNASALIHDGISIKLRHRSPKKTGP